MLCVQKKLIGEHLMMVLERGEVQAEPRVEVFIDREGRSCWRGNNRAS